MRRGAGLVLIFCAVLLVAFAGCADLQKKIIRVKKAPPPRPRFNVDPVRLSNQEYYQQRYLYWKGWQSELIKDLGGNHKKELQDVFEARRHLAALPNYLIERQADALAQYVGELEALTKPIVEKRLSITENARLRRKLEALRLRVEKRFSPKDMRSFLKPDLPPMDLTLYGEEEELPLPSSLIVEKAASP